MDIALCDLWSNVFGIRRLEFARHIAPAFDVMAVDKVHDFDGVVFGDYYGARGQVGVHHVSPGHHSEGFNDLGGDGFL